MNNFDKEIRIIEHFQSVSCANVVFLNPNKEIETVFNNVHDTQQWEKWNDNSGKNAPPPDFYSDEFSLMMEVMRIDDHAFENEKGKIINPTNKRESELQQEIKESGILECVPNIKEIIAIPHTKLETEEDHNYDFYLQNFKRAIIKHNKQVDLYNENQPNKKLIFFVLDESTAYFELNTTIQDGINGIPHLFFLDKNFLEVILSTDIDYFVWYAPFKLLMAETGIVDLPSVCIVDVKKELPAEIVENIKRYDKTKMMSSEK